MNATVKQSNKAALVKLVRKRASLDALFKGVFNTDDGKQCLVEIMRMAGFFEPNTEKTTEFMLIKEGQRRLAIGIADYVFGKNKAAEMLKMLEETQE